MLLTIFVRRRMGRKFIVCRQKIVILLRRRMYSLLYGRYDRLLKLQEVWTSQQGLPQFITLDLRGVHKRPKQIRYIGFDLWHDYDSNPKIIQVQIKEHSVGKEDDYITWRNIHLEHRAGQQFFSLDPITIRYNLIKVLIKETFGASKTYLNQIFLFSQNPNLHEDSSKSSKNKLKVSRSLLPWKSSRRQYDIMNQSKVRSMHQEQQFEQIYSSNNNENSVKNLNNINQSPSSNNLKNSSNLLQTEQRLDILQKNLHNMSLRLQKTQKNQELLEDRICKKLQEYLDRKLQEKLQARESIKQKKQQHIHTLINELNEKLMLREQKLKKLKKKPTHFN